MSLETWKAEFYPTPAAEFAPNPCGAPPDLLGAVQHSIQKWEGLRSVNLQEHGAKVDEFRVGALYFNGQGLYVGGDTGCALCHASPRGCRSCAWAKAHGESCEIRYEAVRRAHIQGGDEDAAITLMIEGLREVEAFLIRAGAPEES